MLPPIRDPVVEMLAKSLYEFSMKDPGGINCFSIHTDPCIVKVLVKVPLDPFKHL